MKRIRPASPEDKLNNQDIVLVGGRSHQSELSKWPCVHPSHSSSLCSSHVSFPLDSVTLLENVSGREAHLALLPHNHPMATIEGFPGHAEIRSIECALSTECEIMETLVDVCCNNWPLSPNLEESDSPVICLGLGRWLCIIRWILFRFWNFGPLLGVIRTFCLSTWQVAWVISGCWEILLTNFLYKVKSESWS